MSKYGYLEVFQKSLGVDCIFLYNFSNEAIYWLITKPQENKKIVLNIREIDIEYSSDCVYDKLTIYDGKMFICLEFLPGHFIVVTQNIGTH